MVSLTATRSTYVLKHAPVNGAKEPCSLTQALLCKFPRGQSNWMSQLPAALLERTRRFLRPSLCNAIKKILFLIQQATTNLNQQESLRFSENTEYSTIEKIQWCYID